MWVDHFQHKYIIRFLPYIGTLNATKTIKNAVVSKYLHSVTLIISREHKIFLQLRELQSKELHYDHDYHNSITMRWYYKKYTEFVSGRDPLTSFLRRPKCYAVVQFPWHPLSIECRSIWHKKPDICRETPTPLESHSEIILMYYPAMRVSDVNPITFVISTTRVYW